MHLDPSDGPHGGLDGFGLEGVGRARGAQHMLYAEPVGRAQDGAQVAGILHIVQCQAQCLGQPGHVERVVGLVKHGYHPLRAGLGAGPSEFVVACLHDFLGLDAGVCLQPFGGGCQEATRQQGQQFFGQFVAFGRKKPIFRPEFFQFQRMDPFCFGFAQHDLIFCLIKISSGALNDEQK